MIVCRDGEKAVIERVIHQLNFRIQGIIIESQLVRWYDLALRGHFQKRLGNDLLHSLKTEFEIEFPFSHTFEGFYRERKYHEINQPDSPFWIGE